LSARKSENFIEKIHTLDQGVQVFAASHDRGLIDMAEESSDWNVYDLGEKR